jgi:hypothetical protein
MNLTRREAGTKVATIEERAGWHPELPHASSQTLSQLASEGLKSAIQAEWKSLKRERAKVRNWLSPRFSVLAFSRSGS